MYINYIANVPNGSDKNWNRREKRKSDERQKNGSKVLLSTIKVLDSVLSFWCRFSVGFFFLMQIFIAAFVLAHSRADILLHSIYQYMSSFKWYSFAQSNHFKLTLFTSISLTAQRRTDVLRTIFFLRLLNTFSFAISIWIREWTLSSIFLASRMDFVRFFFQLNFSHFFFVRRCNLILFTFLSVASSLFCVIPFRSIPFGFVGLCFFSLILIDASLRLKFG